MTEDKKTRVLSFINSGEWKFSKRMPQWPHHYILRSLGSDSASEKAQREFDYLAGLIREYGYDDKWGRRTDKYLVIDGLKYWNLDNVINRAEPISNEQMIKNGKDYIKRNKKRIGPYGCLIAL